MSEQAPPRIELPPTAAAARADLASTPAALPEPPLTPPETPFVGLVPFAASDAPFFFGRERERRLIAANLMASRLTLLYGASGVGKSSVLRAGLEHDLRAHARRELRRGNLPEWIPVVFASWRDDPIPDLRDQIGATLAETLGGLAPEPPSAGRLDDALAQWIVGLDALASDDDGDRRIRLLIVLDQFEEYFLYHGDEDGEGTVAVELPRAVNREGLRANFAIAIREDAYAQLDRFKGRIPNLFDSYLRIRHLDRDAARRAITMPIDVYNGLLAEREEPFAVEAALVEQVLDEVKAGSVVLGQAGGGSVSDSAESRIEAPFLQLVLRRLWLDARAEGTHILTLARLRELGGAEHIVRAHLREAMAEIEPAERNIAASAFHQLVTPSGTKIAHTVADLAGYAGTRQDELLPTLRKLERARILRPVDPPAGETVPRFEIFHDVLAGAVLDWCETFVRERDEALRRSTDRRRLVRRLATAIGGGLVVATVAAALLAIFALTERDRAIEQTRIARSQTLANTALAQLDIDPELAALIALEAVKASPTPEAARALRVSLAQSHVRHTLSGDTDEVTDSEWTSGGRAVLTSSRDGTVRLWNADTGRELRKRLLSGPARDVAVDSSGRLLAAAVRGVGPRLWQAASAKLVRLTGAGRDATAVALTRDGRLLAAADAGRGGGGPVVRIWRTSGGPPVVALRGHKKFVFAAAFSSDGRRVVTASADRTARVWDVRTGRSVVVLPHEAQVLDAGFSPDDSQVVTASGDKTARLWSLTRVRPRRVLRGHAGPVLSASFAPDGTEIATASADGTARIWDLGRDPREPLVLRGHAGAVNAAAISPDGRSIVTAGADRTARIWGISAPAPLRQVALFPFSTAPASLFTAAYWGVMFAPGGRSLLAWAAGARPTVVDVATGTRVATGHAESIRSADVARRGPRVATTSRTGPAVVWALPEARRIAAVVGHGSGGQRVGAAPNSRIRSVALDADGGLLATGGYDGTVRIWDVASRQTLHILRTGGELAQVAFSPYGRLLVTTSLGGGVRLWDARSGEQLRRLGRSSASCPSFSPDGRLVMACEDDGATRVWRVRGGRRPVAVFRGNSGGVLSAAFSRDSRRAATTGGDRTVRVWDVATGAATAVVAGVEGVPASFSSDGSLVAVGGSIVEAESGRAIQTFGEARVRTSTFSPNDDTLVATVAEDQRARIYRCALCGSIDELVAVAQAHLTRTLTPKERARFVDS